MSSGVGGEENLSHQTKLIRFADEGTPISITLKNGGNNLVRDRWTGLLKPDKGEVNTNVRLTRDIASNTLIVLPNGQACEVIDPKPAAKTKYPNDVFVSHLFDQQLPEVQERIKAGKLKPVNLSNLPLTSEVKSLI